MLTNVQPNESFLNKHKVEFSIVLAIVICVATSFLLWTNENNLKKELYASKVSSGLIVFDLKEYEVVLADRKTGTYSAVIQNPKGLLRPRLGEKFDVIQKPSGEMRMCKVISPDDPCYDIKPDGKLMALLESGKTLDELFAPLRAKESDRFP